MSWYRKYRPTTIAGLHLTKVRQAMLEMMQRGSLPQALLFAGPKGTGKTSTSRIIAALLNDPANAAAVEAQFLQRQPGKKSFDEPNLKDSLVQRIQNGSSLVVTELDAASNRGIDDIRQLKERIALPPQEGLVSVFILDEAHMLTTEAFNALLKVLEEPPAHVIFILATTELHKIPATIVSRCAVVTFTQATPEELIIALTTVLDQEKIKYEPDALAAVAQRAEGSFRDAIKLSELIVAQTGSLTTAGVDQVAGVSLAAQVLELVENIVAKNDQRVTQIFTELRDQQVAATFFEKSLLEFLHSTLLQALGVLPGQPVVSERVAHFLLTELQTAVGVTVSPIPLLSLELKCLELVWRAKDKQTGTGGGATITKTPMPAKKVSSAAVVSSPLVSEIAGPILISDNLVVPPVGDASKLLEKWQEFIEGVKERNSSLAAILGSAKPALSDNHTAVIQVYYQFHKDQLQQPKFKKMIEDAMGAVLGEAINLEFMVVSNKPEVVASAMPSPGLATLAVEALV